MWPSSGENVFSSSELFSSWTWNTLTDLSLRQKKIYICSELIWIRSDKYTHNFFRLHYWITEKWQAFQLYNYCIIHFNNTFLPVFGLFKEKKKKKENETENYHSFRSTSFTLKIFKMLIHTSVYQRLFVAQLYDGYKWIFLLKQSRFIHTVSNIPRIFSYSP